MVPEGGVEPPRPKSLEPKSSASTSSAIRALKRGKVLHVPGFSGIRRGSRSPNLR